jgi:hypothetical protein
MKKYIFFLLYLFLISCNNSDQNHIFRTSLEKIKRFHKGYEKKNIPLKLVYFHPKDKQPIKNWEERLSRCLDEVSDYYKEELKKYGIHIKALPFEKKNGKYNFHVVKGYHNADFYKPHMGGTIKAQIGTRIGDKVNIHSDYMVVFNNLTFKREDSTHVFHSPYNGWGGRFGGGCMLADCELLDPLYLKDKSTKMKFGEQSFDCKECLVAEFNSWYIGGIAHELGHTFGYSHDLGNPKELNPNSISLMGEKGSRHFKDYLWGGKKSAFISACYALHLISQPIFTKSNKSFNRLQFQLKDLTLIKEQEQYTIKGEYSSNEQPYAISAYIRQYNQSNYYNKSYISDILNSKNFEINLTKFETGKYICELDFLYPNGQKIIQVNHFEVYQNGEIELLSNLSKLGETDSKTLLQKLLKKPKGKRRDLKIKILNELLKKKQLINLSTTELKKVSLSDAEAITEKVGWEKPLRNHYGFEENKFFLQLKGKIYEKGLYAHSPSIYSFKLEKKWKRFSARIGIQQGLNFNRPMVSYTIKGDGKTLYQFHNVGIKDLSEIKISVENIDKLELIVDSDKKDNHNGAWSIWVDPYLEK